MQVLEFQAKHIIKDLMKTLKILFIDVFYYENIALKPLPGTYDKPVWSPGETAFQFNQEILEV
jgi:hypothetical protein